MERRIPLVRATARTLFMIMGLLVPTCVQAATCQQSVVSSGTLFSGQTFTAQVHVQGLSLDGTFKAAQKQFDASGLRVVEDDRARGRIAATANPKLLEPARRVTLDYRQQKDTAIIDITQSYPPGVIMTAAVAGDQLCRTLSQLLRDARPPFDPRPKSAIVIDAAVLALQVKNARDNPARLNTQFIGRAYAVGGTVRRISETRTGYAVTFDVDPPTEDYEVRKAWIGIDVQCQVERSHAPDIAALSVKGPARLVGRFAKFDDYRATPTIILENCREP
jgi:hypothetical protein